MADLHVPGAPHNMRFPEHLRGKLKMVEHDVLNVCKDLQKIDRNLYVVLQEGHPEPWVIMEHTHTGTEEMVFRTKQLDQRVLDRVRYLQTVPFEQRMKQLFKDVDSENERSEKAWMESEQHERFLWDFRKAMEEAGIAAFTWTTSYRPVKGAKRGSR